MHINTQYDTTHKIYIALCTHTHIYKAHTQKGVCKSYKTVKSLKADFYVFDMVIEQIMPGKPAFHDCDGIHIQLNNPYL